jgi:hypothetical protein
MTQPLKILLVEPKSRNTYPPLGLMKLATYHKSKGSIVHYINGTDSWCNSQFWDKIYISSMFTFDFKELIRTIKYYSDNLFNFKNIVVGGVAATLMADKVEGLTGITPHIGTLSDEDAFLVKLAKSEDWASYLLTTKPCIDNLPPDYAVISPNSQYTDMLRTSYILYSTKGCPNTCNFCAVGKLEPEYVDYIPITPRVKYIQERFGEKVGMLFLDNNIAASKQYNRIIDEIKDLGFTPGSKLNRRQRFVDFNQGIDARLMDSKKMKKLAEIAINPLRLAFDDIRMEKIYVEKMKLATKCGIMHQSNYMLYNYKDEPVDLYKRLKISVDLNADFGAKIFSFPMKFTPLDAADRSFVGRHWRKRQLRAIQLILNVTKGIVSARRDFFEHAFGYNEEEYHRILLMPEQYILYRVKHEDDGSIAAWNKAYSALTENQHKQFFNLIADGRLKEIPVFKSAKMNAILEHYRNEQH